MNVKENEHVRSDMPSLPAKFCNSAQRLCNPPLFSLPLKILFRSLFHVLPSLSCVVSLISERIIQRGRVGKLHGRSCKRPKGWVNPIQKCPKLFNQINVTLIYKSCNRQESPKKRPLLLVLHTAERISPVIPSWVVYPARMREIVHCQVGQCGNQIGAKVCGLFLLTIFASWHLLQIV